MASISYRASSFTRLNVPSLLLTKWTMAALIRVVGISGMRSHSRRFLSLLMGTFSAVTSLPFRPKKAANNTS